MILIPLILIALVTGLIMAGGYAYLQVHQGKIEWEDIHAAWAGTYDAWRVKVPSLPVLIGAWDQENIENVRIRRHWYVFGYVIGIGVYALAGLGTVAFLGVPLP